MPRDHGGSKSKRQRELAADAPKLRQIGLQASYSFASFVMDILTDATTAPVPSTIGTAMVRTPISTSWSFIA